MGHHEQFPVDRGLEEHLAGRRRPGIAEALFATALGLVAAIPAVIAYNKLSTEIGRYGGRLDAFTSEFSAILSRQMDEKV